MFDWDRFLVLLRSFPPHCHRILPLCSEQQIQAVEVKLGSLPPALKEMLKRFNGAELFISGGPLVSIFRISDSPPMSSLEWAPEWCIDLYTPRWREAGSDREGDWAIAMTSYGGLVLMDTEGTIKEWDTGESIWILEKLSLEQWLEKVISEGELIMAEC